MRRKYGSIGTRALSAFFALLPSTAALAHADAPPAPHDLWSAWTLDPFVTLPLAFVAVLYSIGLSRQWRRAGTGRGPKRWQAATFLGGMLALVLALVWPLDALGEALFTAHMAQHVLLVAVVPPLMVVGAPMAPLMRGLPAAWRRRLVGWGRQGWWRAAWRRLSAPGAAALLHGVALWAWHAPAAFQAALANEAVHIAEHASFLFTGLLFWWAIVRSGRVPELGFGVGILWMLVTVIHSGLLGALITFAPMPLYPAYANRAAAWGLTLLEDQQLAGLVMWVPGGMIYLVAGVALMAAWLKALERRAQRAPGLLR
jgi:putative membrane protein